MNLDLISKVNEITSEIPIYLFTINHQFSDLALERNLIVLATN